MSSAFTIASLPPDVGARLRADYPETHAEVTREIESFISAHDYLAHPRIVRCIIHLARTRGQSLQWALEVGAGDPRDVMLLAEYEGLSEDETPRQVRDFNKPFGQNEL